MLFKSKKSLFNYLLKLIRIGSGSQGVCYLDKTNGKIYKIFHDFFDDDLEEEFKVNYKKEEFTKFSKISNDTYVFPEEIIMVGFKVCGYITKYARGLDLCGINPFTINLDTFTSDIINAHQGVKQLSQEQIMSYDVLYNILYGVNGFKIIDTTDYSFTDLDYQALHKQNKEYFDRAIKLFLVSNFFNSFVNTQKDLKEMYKDADSLEFIKLFRQRLSEQLGNEVLYLRDAKDLAKHTRNTDYIRTLTL